MSLLITPSLISSVDFYQTCPPSWKRSAYDSLRRMLSRASWEPTTPIIKGLKFENVVYDSLEGKIQLKTHTENFQKFLDICKGGNFQHKSKQNVIIDDLEYCLYGKLDVYFPPSEEYGKGHIIDIKTTKKFASSKYLKTWQHIIYCLNTQIPTFDYLVGVWEEPDSLTDYRLKSVHEVKYKVEDFDKIREDLYNKVREITLFLKRDRELWELFTKTYSMY